MADVFLSYARANLGKAQELAARLRAAGFSLWFDEDLPAHRAFSEVIEEQLQAARSVFVVWSREAVASQWVRSEANRGREKGRLVQVRVDDARLPMPFDQIHCADLADWNGNEGSPSWQSVVAGISALTGEERKDRHAPQQAGKPSGRTSRRNLLFAGGAAVAAAALGFGAWRMTAAPEVSPQAALLIQKGMDALQNNDALETQDPGSTLQAIALLTEATAAAPQSATAWGALAMAYAVRKRTAELSERAGLESRSRAAANKALDLNQSEFRALGALRLIEPVYRNWSIVERDDREALRANPRVPILLFILADMLGSVGRWVEASEFSRQLNRKKFLIPGADRKLVIDLWASGDLQGADRALDVAVRQWPQHPQIWRTRLAYLMYSGRPAEALAILENPTDLPLELKAEYVTAVRLTAEALAGRRPRSEAVRHDLDYLRNNPNSALQVAQACVALGDPDAAFRLFDGYYFGEGEWRQLAPKGGDEDRITNLLFLPVMHPIWRLPEFDRLLERIGLNEYWRRSGTAPDFRRRA
jgi:tetratricopeptide (TPR) repeat protein